MKGSPRVIIRAPSGQWLLFANPVRVVRAQTAAGVRRALAEIEQAVQAGLSAAGFLSYEAAPAFDRAFVTHPRGRLPLLWFGLFHGPREMAELPDPEAPFSVGAWTPTVTRVAYAAAIRRIKRLIHAGDTYQVNYTLRLRAAFSGDPYALFHRLCRAQKAGCGAFISADDWAVCSASPELFFRLKGDRLLSRPMKGTAPRGLTREEDEDNASGLRQSAKNRAENVMIVDMVRNDLGRVALPGSVRVVRAFEIERYPTVLQMTSTVRARTTASFREILGALFPCASITGAPKVRTMQIIQEVETTPRGAYTGAAGYLLPGREAAFNVAIRTVVVDRRAGRAEYGVGGGVVWDSRGGDEYAESLLKARILTEAVPRFELLETLLWTPGKGYFLLDRHVRRMEQAAQYFGFAFSVRLVIGKLMRLAASLPPKPHKVRCLAGESGRVSVEAARLEARKGRTPLKVAIARASVDSADRFLYHKTTNRSVYDLARAACPGCDDVILHNERGEVTEATVANVAVKIGGTWVTPPVSAGLLAGVYREHLLETGRVRERNVTLDDLRSARGIALMNSVRRWMPAELVGRGKKQRWP